MEDTRRATDSAQSLLSRRIDLTAINWEMAAYGALFLLAILSRFYGLGDRALHHDEGQHALFSWYLFLGQGYRYNPMLHGPFLYHANALIYLLFGTSDATARVLPAIFGVTLVLLPLGLRPWLGRMGSLCAAFLFAISPSFLYFSRFIRQDIYGAVLSLIVFVCILRYWRERRPRWIIGGLATLALSFANKEDTYITVAIFGSFLVLMMLLRLPLDAHRRSVNEGETFSAVLRNLLRQYWAWGGGVLAFGAVFFLLFTTFLTNRHGLQDGLIESIRYWLAQHDVRRGAQPWFYYLLLLPLYEPLVFFTGLAATFVALPRRATIGIPAVAGVFLALFGLHVDAGSASAILQSLSVAILIVALVAVTASIARRDLFLAFLVYWSFAALGIYSWAGEKMPWIVLTMALPLTLLTAAMLGRLVTAWRRPAGTTLRRAGRYLFALAAIIPVAYTIHSAWVLTYQHGDNAEEMLVYVQTTPDVPGIASQIRALSGEETLDHSMPIAVDHDLTWPFGWYLREERGLSYVSYEEGIPNTPLDASVVLVLKANEPAYQEALGDQYVGVPFKFNWWFPEDYQQWTPAKLLSLLSRGDSWRWLERYLVYRDVGRPLGARDSIFYIRKDILARRAPSSPQQEAVTKVFAKLPALGSLGTYGSAAGQFASPRDVAVDRAGLVYVVDSLNHRVQVLDAKGNVVRILGSRGDKPGQFEEPNGIAVDSAGNIVVTDTWNHRIQVFDHSGRFLRQWGSLGDTGGDEAVGAQQPYGLYGPRGVAIGPDGNVYVTDTGNKRVAVYTITGQFVRQWGRFGSEPGAFQEPIGLAVAPTGNVYVADTWNRRVQEFSATGEFIRLWAFPGWQRSAFDEPHLALGSAGTLYVTDPPNNRVIALAEGSGAPVLAWGGIGKGQDSLYLPTGISVGEGGNVYVADTGNNRVQVFAPER